MFDLIFVIARILITVHRALSELASGNAKSQISNAKWKIFFLPDFVIY